MTGTLSASATTALPESQGDGLAPVRSAWGVVILLAVVLFAGALMRTVFSPLQEAAKLDLHLSDVTIGLIQGFGAGAPIALFSIPLAWVVDHGNRVKLLIGLLGLCVIGTLWTAFAGSFTPLLIARMLSALGATCAISAIISLSADLCAPDKRGRAIVLLGLGVYAGTAIAFALGGKLLAVLGVHPIPLLGAMAPWRATHLLIGLAGTLLLVPLFFLREPPRQEVEIRGTALGPIFRALLGKWRFLAPLFIGQIGVSMADTAAAIWATPVLVRHYHLQPVDFAGWMGAVIFFAGLFGSMLGGFGADLGHKSGRRGALLLVAVIAAGLGIPAALFPLMASVSGFAWMFFLLALCGSVCSVAVSTTVAVLVPNEERGACMAAFGVINAIVALSLAPFIVTLASQAMGGEQHLSLALAITGVVTGVISLIGYVLAMRNAPLSATEGHEVEHAG